MINYNRSTGRRTDYNDVYEKTFECEKIVSISGLYDHGDDFSITPNTQYFGVKIVTENHIIRAYISPERDCCERYGAMLSQDDLSEYVGSELRKIYLTNTALKTEHISYIRAEKSSSTEYDNIQFINFETGKGTFQLTVYNCDNVYYGHDIVIRIDDTVEYRKTASGDEGW